MMKRILTAAVAGTFLLGGLAVDTAHAARPLASSVRETVTLHALHGSRVAGAAVFAYSSRTNITTVALRVTGLKAMTVHPAHIHAGASCAANGPVIYSFHPLGGSMMTTTEAGAAGVLRASTSFRGSFVGKKFYINVHTGPTLTTKAQFAPLACGVLAPMM